MKTENDFSKTGRSIFTTMFGILILSIVALTYHACNKDENTSRIHFYLTDAPSLQGYKAVYIDIEEITYSVNGNKWYNLPITPVIVDLMKFTNGEDTLLSTIVLDEGIRIQQVRLKLGSDNSLILSNGTRVSLDTPSGKTSGIKINIHDSTTVYSSYSIVIDFNAEKSIVRKGNSGGYSLKPVILGFIRENTSLLFGTILPPKVLFKVSSINGTDTMTCISDTSQNNKFVLQGLYSGTWKVNFQDATNVIVDTKYVDIVGGIDKDLGVVDLND